MKDLKKINGLNHTTARGFTLLEMMVVIVILGILASLVIPNLMGNKEKADQKKVVSDIVALENSLDMYRLDNNLYPTTEQGLSSLVTKPTISPEPPAYRLQGYIKRLPRDPWGHRYQYINPGEKGTIDIYSLGMDGEEGGEGSAADIGNWNLHEYQK